MPWLVIILLAAVALVLMLQVQQRYEGQSAQAALHEAEALRERVEELERRVENLEVIATDETRTFERREAPLDPEIDEGIASEDSSSVSLTRSKDRS